MPDAVATAAQLGDLRASARDRDRSAAAARRVALDIDRRREAMVHRADAGRARHVPEVWSSTAASISRDELVARVGGWLQASAGSLRETSVALELEARRLESLARSLGHEADAVERELGRQVAEAPADQATLTRSVSSTSPRG